MAHVLANSMMGSQPAWIAVYAAGCGESDLSICDIIGCFRKVVPTFQSDALEDAMYRSIMVPVDLAEADLAQPAIAAAVSFAKISGGKVRLVYVRSLIPVTYMEFVPADFDSEQQEDAEAKLAEIAAKVDLPAERVSAKVLIGSVHGEVLAEADASGADLIVIGSHEPGMLAYVIGSNASAIVRRAKCSVLVVR